MYLEVSSDNHIANCYNTTSSSQRKNWQSGTFIERLSANLSVDQAHSNDAPCRPVTTAEPYYSTHDFGQGRHFFIYSIFIYITRINKGAQGRHLLFIPFSYTLPGSIKVVGFNGGN